MRLKLRYCLAMFWLELLVGVPADAAPEPMLLAPPQATTPADVNRLLKQFGEMQRLMRQFGAGRLPRGGNGLRSILGG